LTVAYKVVDENSFQLPQVGFTVSKSKFKHAVDRNRIKRLMRQAYRTNKTPFLNKLQEDNKALALMFIYNKHKMPKGNEIEISVKSLLEKLSSL
jgi:ribonuclease P protein component